MPLVTVRLQQRHMLQAKRGSSCYCPLAHAINDVIPYGMRVAVAKDRVIVLGIKPDPRPASVEIPLHPQVCEIVAAYDAGAPMRLMTFPMQFPDI
jgi:hypothetical protein